MIDNNSKVFVNDNGDRISLTDIRDSLMKNIAKYGEAAMACYIQYGGALELKGLCTVGFSSAGCFKIKVYIDAGVYKLFDSQLDAIDFLNKAELNRAKLIIERQNEILKELELIGCVGE